jgi:hypothetical protein
MSTLSQEQEGAGSCARALRLTPSAAVVYTMPIGHGCSAALLGRSLWRTCGGCSSSPRPPSAPNVPPLQLVIVHHLPHRLLPKLATVIIPDELGRPVVQPTHQNPPDALGRVGIPAGK